MSHKLFHRFASLLLALAVLGSSRDTQPVRAAEPRYLARTELGEVIVPAETQIIFASDATWTVSDSTGASLGFAQSVCLNASWPPDCPAGATFYEYPGSGWEADRSSIPGATWIWAPGVTGTTSPAFPAEFFFLKEFKLSGTPTAGSISVAADDFAEVFVNASSVGTVGSVTNESLAGAAQSSLTAFNITSFLVPGTNVITIRAANGNFGCGAGPYSCNPAGVVFGGSLQFQSAVLEVGIDIKPGSQTNPINPKSTGKIPVAILSTPDFNALAEVDRASLTFGRTGDEHSLARCNKGGEDVNGDGLLDLVCHFKTKLTGFKFGDTEGILKGQTVDGMPIEGRDVVKIVGLSYPSYP